MSFSTALRDAATDVPAYDVLDAAITQGGQQRRRVRRRSVAAAVIVLALLGVLVTPLLRPARPPIPASPGPSLPAMVWKPGPFVPGITDSPAGPASVLFWTGGNVVAVGATDDTYRRLPIRGARPGQDALLSPTGDRLAYAMFGDIRVLDLSTGQTRHYVSPAGYDAYRPAAWLPDGHGLVVLAVSQPPENASGRNRELRLLDLDSGTLDTFAAATFFIAMAGQMVAVSPDGGRIAYQYSDFVTIYDRATRAKTTFTLPDADSVLAGRGSWTPDGQTLAILHRGPDRRWELRLVDPTTGVERDPGHRPSLGGTTIFRVLGWTAGNPIVASTDLAVRELIGNGIEPNEAPPGVTRIVVLEPNGPRPLLSSVDGPVMLDVADEILASGRTRPGQAPPYLPTGWTIGVSTALLAVLALLGAGVLLLLRRRARRAARPRAA